MTKDTPQTPDDHAEVEYGDHVIWNMVNSTIVAFGANEEGEIYLSTVKDGVLTEIIIGKDEDGEVSLFEVEKKEEAQ